MRFTRPLDQGYRKRPVRHDAEAERALKARTLTNQYNDRPQWLADTNAASMQPWRQLTGGKSGS